MRLGEKRGRRGTYVEEVDFFEELLLVVLELSDHGHWRLVVSRRGVELAGARMTRGKQPRGRSTRLSSSTGKSCAPNPSSSLSLSPTVDVASSSCCLHSYRGQKINNKNQAEGGLTGIDRIGGRGSSHHRQRDPNVHSTRPSPSLIHSPPTRPPTRLPSSSPSSPSHSHGYLVYSQNGPTVHKRVSEIMPGDIVEVHDAKLKGHKGIHGYHMSVGTDEPALGVVSEFEPKKSKIRVFQANQHVGQQVRELSLLFFKYA